MENYFAINIGRQYGSGGLNIANYLAGKLAIKAYDKELLTMAASNFGINEEEFIKADEKRHCSFLAGLVHSIVSPNDTSFNTSVITQESLFDMQSEVIRKLSETESCIIVGRCADYILRDKKRVLNVFLSADMPVRIERISSRVGIPPEEAESIILKNDKERAKYYNFYTMKKWGAAESYDLCINTTKLGIEGTGDYIIEFAKQTLAPL